MHRLFIAAFGAVAVCAFALPASAANVGSSADIAAIRKSVPAKFGRCVQRVDHVAVQGSYALATVLQTGGCDSAVVWVLQKRGTWRRLGAIGGVPDACTVHAQGVPLGAAGPLVAAFTGTSNPSLVSTKGCRG